MLFGQLGRGIKQHILAANLAVSTLSREFLSLKRLFEATPQHLAAEALAFLVAKATQ